MASKITAEVRPEKAARDELVEHDAKGEEIRPRVEVLAPRLLRRHVGHGPQRHSRAAQGVVPGERGLGLIHRRALDCRRRRELGEAEVEDLGLAPPRVEDVRGLDVPVDDPLPVRGVEGVGNLDPDVHDLVDVEARGAHVMLERLALEPLHHDVMLALVLADVVDGADVRVVEGRGGAGLALEPFHRARVLRQLGGKELQRDAAAEAQVLGLVDDAHPAPPSFSMTR
jgi:hypothetical protein